MSLDGNVYYIWRKQRCLWTTLIKSIFFHNILRNKIQRNNCSWRRNLLSRYEILLLIEWEILFLSSQKRILLFNVIRRDFRDRWFTQRVKCVKQRCECSPVKKMSSGCDRSKRTDMFPSGHVKYDRVSWRKPLANVKRNSPCNSVGMEKISPQ